MYGKESSLEDCREPFKLYAPIGKTWKFLKAKKLWYWIALVSIEIDQQPKALSLYSWTNLWSSWKKPCIWPKMVFKFQSTPKIKFSWFWRISVVIGDDSINESFNFKKCFIYGLLYVVKFEFGIDSKFVVVHLYKPAMFSEF